MRSLKTAFWFLAVLGIPCLATAGGLTVLFEDGRTLEVKSAVISDDVAVLTLEDGDRIAVPAYRVTNWQEIKDYRPAPASARNTESVSAAWRSAAGDLAHLIAASAERNRLDPVLLTAMAGVESNYDPRAVSHKGASGVMQLMPATAERFGVADVFDVEENIEGGAKYMSWLLDRFEGRTDLALAGYNAGENAVDRYQGVPPYPETQDYVAKVMARAARLGGSAE